jgi:hypothetical protein
VIRSASRAAKTCAIAPCLSLATWPTLSTGGPRVRRKSPRGPRRTPYANGWRRLA